MALQLELDDYGRMIIDRTRPEAYLKALRQTITPESVVLDIGCGTGFFSLISCQCGARQVYALEPNEAIQLARDLALANDCANRIEFIQAMSHKVSLPEPVEIIVSDVHGALPLFRQAIPTIIDARRRFLAPGGIIIPQIDTVWAAIVELTDMYHEITAPWDGNVYGLDQRAGRQIATNILRNAQIKAEQLLAAPQCWVKLNYTLIESPDAAGNVTLEIARKGIGHGVALWFDSILIDGVGFSNAPGAPGTIYGQVFLPWPEPVALAKGDSVTLSVQAALTGEEYLWRWVTKIMEQGDQGRLKADFRQSNFYGSFISSAKLRQGITGYVPILNEDGHIDKFILILMDGKYSQGEIASKILERFPRCFENSTEALRRVGKLSSKYGFPPEKKYLPGCE